MAQATKRTYVIEYGFSYPSSTFDTNITATSRKKALDFFFKNYSVFPSFISLKRTKPGLLTKYGININRKQIPRHSEKAKFTANW